MTQKKQTDYNEEGVEVPYEQINPDTLRKLVEEFVTREWSELSDSGYSLEEKKVKVVFDFTSGTANIVV